MSEIGQQGIFNIWAFRRKNKTLYWTGPFTSHEHRRKEGNNHPIWENVDQLEKNGLLTFVPHLWDHDSRQAEIVHPYGIDGIGGEQIEIDLGNAAHSAAEEMALECKVREAEEEDYIYLAPVKNTLPNVQMIGVARLTYRPHTRRTGDWFRELNESASGWIRRYQELHERATKSKTVVAGGF
jgi:hypothetical protein